MLHPSGRPWWGFLQVKHILLDSSLQLWVSYSIMTIESLFYASFIICALPWAGHAASQWNASSQVSESQVKTAQQVFLELTLWTCIVAFYFDLLCGRVGFASKGYENVFVQTEGVSLTKWVGVQSILDLHVLAFKWYLISAFAASYSDFIPLYGLVCTLRQCIPSEHLKFRFRCSS